jgi:chemotaxis protein CheZ
MGGAPAGEDMGAPRTVFRIEEIADARRDPQVGDLEAPRYAKIMHELAALRATLAAEPSRPEVANNAARLDEMERLAAKLRLIRSSIIGADAEHPTADASRAPGAAPTARIAHELEAVMEGSEQATQKILAAAEEIDQAANNLSAALKSSAERGLAQDIRDRVIGIFEACNYQDLTSQRVAKVMASLERIEHQIARTLDELTRAGAPPMHGPRLEGDRGHASQSDIDTIFAEDAKFG